MKMYTIELLTLILAAMPTQGLASEWVRDVEVTQLGAYQAATHHFVWFGSLSQECKNSPTMYFDDTKIGGKALLAVLMTALVNKRRIDYQAAGCEIVEVYLK
ncbi:hypothetical protein [Xanthomonas arboricola]|uniref:hypothetical protein n=1 Tax=Xanthomonas arboricola TaxID=56448 RepID=UPI000E1FAF81|nr:hypothetical protein [Xanthomonas arboricola]